MHDKQGWKWFFGFLNDVINLSSENLYKWWLGCWNWMRMGRAYFKGIWRRSGNCQIMTLRITQFTLLFFTALNKLNCNQRRCFILFGTMWSLDGCGLNCIIATGVWGTPLCLPLLSTLYLSVGFVKWWLIGMLPSGGLNSIVEILQLSNPLPPFYALHNSPPSLLWI